MSLHAKHPHLVCYDIADPRRLQRVHRYLKKLGLPLQYSVFLLFLDAPGRQRLAAALLEMIDPRHDDVRIYPLPRRPDWQWWGKPLWPDGILLPGLDLPTPLNGAKFDQ
ncbi:CRISPR-associated protein Cas2 [Methylomarinovum tepidoasis]|uniref:CRISPR-associated endoribonuclease Cas2 n=1 Tax=Methylomarinovum tepidoasis TaxID=2840183 RepID=A0AAU9BYW3_9GAMM|nr:CRISPR-associated endonuclease Cas2 [Methylomarinovum sp. IN45]BCX88955.1 CRISPR-associated protein Cas2 [Methylomarinovum sp. IN45]